MFKLIANEIKREALFLASRCGYYQPGFARLDGRGRPSLRESGGRARTPVLPLTVMRLC